MKKTKKRVISCVITAALLVTTIPFPAIAKTSGNLYGDANGDGKIDLLDALAIDKYLAGTAEDNFHSEEISCRMGYYPRTGYSDRQFL